MFQRRRHNQQLAVSRRPASGSRQQEWHSPFRTSHSALRTQCSVLFMLLVCLMLFPALAPAVEITVCPSGCDYTSIEAAIGAASANDTITVSRNTGHARGCYDEHIIISSTLTNLTLQGASVDPANAACIGPSTGGDIVTISASGVTIKDLEISGKTGALNGYEAGGRSSGHGVHITGNDVTGVTIENCTISFAYEDLIRWDGDLGYDGTGGVTIQQCYLHHADHGRNIRIFGGGGSSSYEHIIRNNLIHTGQGILVDNDTKASSEVEFVTIEKNVIKGWPYYGVFALGESLQQYPETGPGGGSGRGWKFYSACIAGIWVASSPSGTEGVDFDIQIKNNLIVGTRKGIRVETKGTIRNNTIANPFNMAHYKTSYTATARKESIRDNTYGIMLVDGFSGTVENNLVVVEADYQCDGYGGYSGSCTNPGECLTPGITGYGIGFYGGSGSLNGASINNNDVWGFVDIDGSTPTNWGSGLTDCGTNVAAECSGNISQDPLFASDDCSDTTSAPCNGDTTCPADTGGLTRCYELFEDNYFLESQRGSCHPNIWQNTAGYVGFVDLSNSGGNNPSTDFFSGLDDCANPFTADSNDSPCIDVGVWPPNNEPTPNGSTRNIGAFGNTDRASLSPMAIYGASFQSNETTALGSGITVRAKVNGSGDYSTTTDGSGEWIINVPAVSAGDTITIYLDNDATYHANAVTIADGGTSDIIGVKLYDAHVLLRSDNGAAYLTNSDINDGEVSGEGADILFSVSQIGSVLTVNDGNELYIDSGAKFKPGYNVDVGTGGIQIVGTWDADTFNINLAGAWDLDGTFTADTSTVILDGTITRFFGDTTFNNLTCVTAGTILRFISGETYTVGATLKLEGASGDLIVLSASSGGSAYTLSAKVISDNSSNPYFRYLNVSDSTAAGDASPFTAYNSTQGTGNTNWTISSGDPSSTIDVSGIVYQSNETTPITGSAMTVNLRVNAAGTDTTESLSGNGAWSFSNISANSGDTITIYFDDELGTTGNVVTITDGSSDISGVALIDDHVVLRNDSGAIAITNNDINAGEVSGEGGDILFSVTDSEPYALSIVDGAELYINTADTFRPGGNVDVGTGGIQIVGTWTADTYNINLAGNWDLDGTFTYDTSTVIIDGSGTSSFSGATTFNDLSCITAGKTLEFETLTTFTVGGTLKLEGSAFSAITLGATQENTFTLNAEVISDIAGNAYFRYLTVSYSTAGGTAVPFVTYNSTDGGNNTNWNIYTGKPP